MAEVAIAQSEKFKRAVPKLETTQDPERFKERLPKIAKQKPVEEKPK